MAVAPTVRSSTTTCIIRPACRSMLTAFYSSRARTRAAIGTCGGIRPAIIRSGSRSGATITRLRKLAGELAKAPSCRRIVFETGRMAPILFHGLSQLGLPVVCVESRQAYQALRSLATHKTDRNDARGLAHLARTGFFKPVHVKSLSAHAVR